MLAKYEIPASTEASAFPQIQDPSVSAAIQTTKDSTAKKVRIVLIVLWNGDVAFSVVCI